MRPPLLAACAGLLAFVTVALAQSSSALINEALDKQQPLQLDGTLPQVIGAIAQKTDVRIEVAPGVYDLLPWGDQTTVKARIENQTLRDGLRAIARRLGLTLELRDEAVELKPLPALRRLGRRATVEELEVLDLLGRTNLELQNDRPTVKQLLAAVDSKLESAKSIFAIEDRTPDAVGSAAVPVPRNATLLDALESIPQSTDATWYPWGGAQRGTLVVRPKVDHVRDLLNKTITRRFAGVDVGQVLSELSSLSGVHFAIEPGAVQRIAGDSRNIRLILDNAPISQALESIAGFTGLAWSVNEKGVYVWNPSGAGGAAGAREPSVGLIMLDNGMQVVIRESQIPPDLREYVKHKTAQHFEKMRKQMQEEGFKPPPPATALTTQPQDL
jgi:hypothetical protein